MNGIDSETIPNAKRNARDKKRWWVRLICTEGTHNKFYSAAGGGVGETVRIHYGRVDRGGKGRMYETSFQDAMSRLESKINPCAGKYPYRYDPETTRLEKRSMTDLIRSVECEIRNGVPMWDCYDIKGRKIYTLASEGLRTLWSTHKGKITLSTYAARCAKLDLGIEF